MRQCLEFIQPLLNFNCEWEIYTSVFEKLFHKKICIFGKVTNVTKVCIIGWMTVVDWNIHTRNFLKIGQR